MPSKARRGYDGGSSPQAVQAGRVIGVPIALEIVTGGAMAEIGPALGAPIVGEAGSAGVFLETLRLTRGRTNPNVVNKMG